MRRSEFSDAEIIDFLRAADAGTPIAQICRTADVSPRTFYRWRKRFGGLEAAGLAELRALQLENRRLRGVLETLLGEASTVSPAAAEGHGERAGARVSRDFFPSLRTGASGTAPLRKQ
jgi:putative transposase